MPGPVKPGEAVGIAGPAPEPLATIEPPGAPGVVSPGKSGPVQVQGSTKKDGTSVPPHTRQAPTPGGRRR